MPRNQRFGWLHLLRALVWVASMFALAACGGRSDQDAFPGVADANLLGLDARPDGLDASVPDADVSAEVGPLDSSLEGGPLPDVRFDARIDGRVDAGHVLLSI